MSELEPSAPSAGGATPPPRPLFGPRSRMARWLEALLYLVPLGFVVAGVLVSDRAREYQLGDVARLVRAERRPGDLVVLGEGLARSAFGDLPGVVTQSDALPHGAFRRIFYVTRKAGPPPTRIAGLDTPPVVTERLLGETRLLELRGLSQSLFASLDIATVRFVHAKDGRSDECRGMKPGEFECPLASWLRVGTASMKVGGRALECITAHPAPEGALHLRFPALRLGKTLVFRTAMADTGSPPPVRVEVRAPDRSLGVFEHKAIPGWETHDLPTGALAGQVAALEVILTVPSGGRHHFCFAGGL